MFALPTGESDEEEDGREMMREEQELGVICVWIEEEAVQHWMRGKHKGSCMRYLFLFNITLLPIPQLSLTYQVTFLFLLSGFGFAKKGKCADRGAGKDSISCGRVGGEGLYVLLWGPMSCSPHVLHPTPPKKCCQFPSATISHKSTRKLHLKLPLLQ